MYIVEHPITLNQGAILQDTLLIPDIGLMNTRTISAGFFQKALICESFRFDIAKTISSPGYWSAFDPFHEKKISKKTSEIGVSFKDGIMRLLSEDLNLGKNNTHQSGSLVSGLEKGLLIETSYGDALDIIMGILENGESEDEKVFGDIMRNQIVLFKNQIKALGFGEKKVYQVQQDGKDAVNLFPKSFFKGPPRSVKKEWFSFGDSFLTGGRTILSPIKIDS